MAAATPHTPLQFMSTGFRFISWETASPDFMALAFRVLARNGIRRFCLADPMNDAESNMACARMVKEGGGEYVIVALVFTISPIHDDAHYIERARTLAASPFIDALYIKDPGGLLKPSRAQNLIPAIKAVTGGKPLELHSHCTIGFAEHTYMDAPNHGVSALQCASGAAADGTSNPHSARVVANLRALGHRVAVWAVSTSTSLSSPRRRACPWAHHRRSMRAIFSISCPAAWSAPRAASLPRPGCRTSRER
jgi:oxaloacetate decarboxylase alpha subunit